MLDQLFILAFASASTAIFEVGSVMAILMLVFGVLDYRFGDHLRAIIVAKKLDQPWLMAALALIPVDGTLLFQYSTYRRRTIRPGSLLGGIIGIGEEATYLVLSYSPLTWVFIAAIKILTATGAGFFMNLHDRKKHWSGQLHDADDKAAVDEGAVMADENFHELPDKFRHKLHHFRYHQLGNMLWAFFAVALLTQLVMKIIGWISGISLDKFDILNIPVFHWLAMFGLLLIIGYRVVIWFMTREFGKIFEHEFEDTGDAIGDLAETCASIIMLIFALTFAVQSLITVIGQDRLIRIFSSNAVLTIVIGAFVGLIPGTGASLAFTTLYFTLNQTSGSMPFAALLACSIALIGDSQFVGQVQIKKSQRFLHLTTFALALAIGLSVYWIQSLIGWV